MSGPKKDPPARSDGEGRLSIVSTPIGNLRDLTLRALDTLREADLILAEDTRHTRRLCTHHGIETPLRAFHAHSSDAALRRALEVVAQGQRVALVTDAGTPLVSDPGEGLVAQARDAGLPVEVIPGPSAVTAALAVSGIRFDAFRFVGFLPRRGGRRRAALEDIAVRPEASVLFEAPRRLADTLTELATQLGDERSVAVCRELTKVHEEVVRGTAAALAAHFAEGALGEITIVVEGRRGAQPPPDPEDVDAAIEDARAAGMSSRDASRSVAERLGLPRRQVYTRIQALADGDPGATTPDPHVDDED